MIHLNEYEKINTNISSLKQLALPALPRSMRYFDDFLDTSYTLNDLQSDCWDIQLNGRKGNIIDFRRFNSPLKELLKSFFVAHIAEHAPNTSFLYFSSLARIFTEDEIYEFIFVSPMDLNILWEKTKIQKIKDTNTQFNSSLSCLKALLKFLSINQLLSWSPSYISIISALQLPFLDKYKVVKNGDCFLTVSQESKLISFFDKQAAHAESLSILELQNICLICCAYQHGMRPTQIGAVKFRDVKSIQQDDHSISIYISFSKIKQRTVSKAIPLIRKVKNEWTPLFYELIRKNKLNPTFTESDYFFGVKSSIETSQRISDTSELIIKERTTPSNFRHSAAQRLVDAGASKEELAEFLGHSDIDTCLIYFDVSATQAERINKALGASETYSTLAKIAHSRFIDVQELQKLKDEQQIAGIPHGFSLSGIGGCESGQPLCPFNPVTSCYGCPKFMPMNKVETHQEVLHSMRLVVKQFVDAGLDDNKSPTFLQLRNVISNIESIIHEIAIQGR